MSYPFLFKADVDNSYGFETELGIIYNVKFKPSDYLLGDVKTEYSDYLFEFVIQLVYNPLKRNPPLDRLVSTTIAAIIEDFYFKKNKSVCIYICDSSDGRQSLRKRKFDEWFYSHENIGVIKYDQIITDSAGNSYPLSVIIRKDNPYFMEIILAFSNITSENSK